MKKVLILSNDHAYTYNLRKEIIQRLIDENYKIYLVLPYGKKIELLKEMGCEFIDLPLDKRGMNPITDMKLFINYYKIIKKIQPDVVLSYTIKPNVYGGLACILTKTPYISNITGLGTSVENKGLIQKVTLFLYKLGLRKVSCVFFQNETNRRFFLDNRIVNRKTMLIPGSGVNLTQHKLEKYPLIEENIRFLFIGRIMKAKGIEELLEAAKKIKQEYSYVQFDLIGGSEENYIQKLTELEKQGVINFHGQQDDVHSFIKDSHVTILPSYHEGLANVLLESASSGRPVLASKVPGCIETYEDGLTGYGFEPKNVDSLVEAIEKFLNLSYAQKTAMGIAGRKKMENEFDRNIIMNVYSQEINLITSKGDSDESIREIS